MALSEKKMTVKDLSAVLFPITHFAIALNFLLPGLN